jgi:hypothetical protein
MVKSLRILLFLVLILSFTGQILAQDEEFSGEIEDDGEKDRYELELEEGDAVIIYAIAESRSDLDTLLLLEDPDGNLVAENDDYEFPDSLDSRIAYIAETDGEYTIVVTNVGDELGEYEVTVEFVDPEDVEAINEEDAEVEDEPESTTPDREPDFVEEGTVEEGEEDEYTLEIEEGQGVIAAVYALDDSLDTIVRVVDEDGNELGANDDRGDYETTDSQIAFTANQDGEYTFLVSGYADSTGDYRIEIYFASAEETAFAEQAMRVVLSGPEEIYETENFIIHYTQEGDDEADEDYIEEVAETVEEVFEIQMDLGWAQPPSDMVQGGDGRYDVYIINLEDIYGYVTSSSSFGDNPNTDFEEEFARPGFLVLDNDYSEYDDPNQAMRATVAHEFHHVVQYGYDSEDDFQWYYEATASWMETVTVPDDEEATIYVEEVLHYPEICFGGQEKADVSGLGVYGTWLFLEYISRELDESVVISLWENIAEYEDWESLEVTLEDYDETIPSIVMKYHLNNLVLDYEFVDSFDGATVWVEDEIDDTGTWTFTGEGIQELGANYFAFDADEDTYSVSITDTDAELELFGIGINGDEADIFELGDEGVIDNSDYDNYYIMVFNPDYDNSVRNCRFVEYGIEIDSTNDDAEDPIMTLNAENFEEGELRD